MPELPEVETVRRGLEERVVGCRVRGVEIGRERTVRRTSPEAVVHGLTGTIIEAAERRGKYLLLPLDSGDVMMIHLRMSGQLLVADPGAQRPPHTHVVLSLGRPSGSRRQEARVDRELWFVDPRTFGEVVVFDPERLAEQVPDVARLGVDPLADEFPLPGFRAMLRSHHRLLKPFLLDQSNVAGIGNIYADEILHRARLRPDRLTDALTPAAERRLHAAIGDILRTAVEAGGSTLGDRQYVDLMGAVGSYQDDHRVYGRGGERCPTCGIGWIRRTVSAQRSTFYCPRCQR